VVAVREEREVDRIRESRQARHRGDGNDVSQPVAGGIRAELAEETDIGVDGVDDPVGADRIGEAEGEVAATGADVGDAGTGSKIESAEDPIRLLPSIATEARIGPRLDALPCRAEALEDGHPSILAASCDSLPSDTMKVICGIGNPGDRYRLTRHNVGFRVVDLLADRWGLTGQGRVRDGAARLEHDLPEPIGSVLLVKPMRYMNRSGGPLRAALRQTDVDVAADLLVVADDVDLPLGRIRLRRSGSAGGHNGLRDIISAFGSNEFARLRVGIGRAGETVDHVLATFRPAEREVADEAIATAADAVEVWLRDGIDEAMNEFNGVDLGGTP
jgi:PTH1 family peptidyl-tRNA hydrolase